MEFFHWQTFVSQLLTFIIAAAIVWKVGWKAIVGIVAERQKSIKSAIENAEQTRQAVAKLEDEYRLKLTDVQKQAADLLAMTRIEAQRMREEILKKAETEATDLRRRMEEQMGFEKQRLVSELRQEMVGLATAVASKVLGQIIDEQAHARRFADTLKELETLSTGKGA
jgi:F-type H+-transporting ATPase subunit b